MYKKLLCFILILFSCIFCQIQFQSLPYIESKFSVHIDSNYNIVFHSKEQVYKQLLKNSRDSSEAKKTLQTIWKISDTIFIDSIYMNLKIKPFKKDGFFIHFFGDSNYYITGYYKNGKMDSIWKYKRIETFSVERYYNCKANGEWYMKYNNGKFGCRQKFSNDINVDTSYSWYENGQLQEIEIFKDGKSFYHKCYTEKGEETFCNPD